MYGLAIMVPTLDMKLMTLEPIKFRCHNTDKLFLQHVMPTLLEVERARVRLGVSVTGTIVVRTLAGEIRQENLLLTGVVLAATRLHL